MTKLFSFSNNFSNYFRKRIIYINNTWINLTSLRSKIKQLSIEVMHEQFGKQNRLTKTTDVLTMYELIRSLPE